MTSTLGHHHVLERGRREGLLYRIHDPRPDRIDVPGEVAAVGVPGDDGRAVLTVEGLAATVTGDRIDRCGSAQRHAVLRRLDPGTPLRRHSNLNTSK